MFKNFLNTMSKDYMTINRWVLLYVVVITIILLILLGYGICKIQKKESYENSKEVKNITLYHKHGCYWCEKLMPVWNKLEKKYPNMINKYESKEHPELMIKHNIKSYPTIMKGDHVYEGDRSFKDLEKYLLN